MSDPGRTRRPQAREAAEAVGEVACGPARGRAPKTPLNAHCGSHRRVVWIHADLAELKAIKNALGGTVNDVFLNVVSGALQRWLRARGVRTEGLELRGAVPVSVRAEDERGAARQQDHDHGRAPCRSTREDPVARQEIVADSMKDLKESKQALGAELIAGLQDFAPPTMFAQASRLNFSRAHVQPARHQRARAAVPALPARARAGEARARWRSWPPSRRWRWRS